MDHYHQRDLQIQPKIKQTTVRMDLPLESKTELGMSHRLVELDKSLHA